MDKRLEKKTIIFFFFYITREEHIHLDQTICFWLLTIVHGNYRQMIRDTDA